MGSVDSMYTAMTCALLVDGVSVVVQAKHIHVSFVLSSVDGHNTPFFSSHTTLD